MIDFSETLLFILRNEENQDQRLTSISNFIKSSSKYCSETSADLDGPLDFSRFCAVILEDPFLEDFFERKFKLSFYLSESEKNKNSWISILNSPKRLESPVGRKLAVMKDSADDLYEKNSNASTDNLLQEVDKLLGDLEVPE